MISQFLLYLVVRRLILPYKYHVVEITGDKRESGLEHGLIVQDGVFVLLISAHRDRV